MYNKKTVIINRERLRVCPECGSSHLGLRDASQEERNYIVAGIPAYQDGILQLLVCLDCDWNTGTKLTTTWISHFSDDWNNRCKVLRKIAAREAAWALYKIEQTAAQGEDT